MAAIVLGFWWTMAALVDEIVRLGPAGARTTVTVADDIVQSKAQGMGVEDGGQERHPLAGLYIRVECLDLVVGVLRRSQAGRAPRYGGNSYV